MRDEYEDGYEIALRDLEQIDDDNELARFLLEYDFPPATHAWMRSLVRQWLVVDVIRYFSARVTAWTCRSYRTKKGAVAGSRRPLFHF